MREQLVISFSGGRTSAFMTWWLLKNCQSKYEMIVVFANTGKEREETLAFVNECDKRFDFKTVWVESITHPQRGKGVTAKVVDYTSASRNGEPFEQMILKHGLPNRTGPRCTRELKAYAIRAYARQIGWKKYYSAIGIRADETRRINWINAGKERLIYPLATMIRVEKKDINAFWARQDFDLQLKSYEGNCDLCWKKSFRKLMTIASENPHLTKWWQEMEQRYEDYIPPNRQVNYFLKGPVRMYRDNRTITDIMEDIPFGFTPAADESKMLNTHRQLAMFNLEYDSEDAGCTQSCEAF